MLRTLGLVLITILIGAAEGVWVPMAGNVGGFDGTVTSFVPWRGKLLVSGPFSTIGSVSAQSVAIWDGTAWTEVPGAAEHAWGRFSCAAAIDDDVVLVRDNVSDPEVERVWRWDGEHWTPLVGCPDDGQIIGIVVCGGDVYLGRTTWNGGAAVLRWNGTAWSELPIRGTCCRIATDGTQVYVSGSGMQVDGSPTIASVVRWDGTTAQAIPGGPTDTLVPIACDPVSGLLWAAGKDTLSSWDGTVWNTISHPIYEPLALCFKGDRLLVGGLISSQESDYTVLASYTPGTGIWSDLATSAMWPTVIASNGSEIWVSGDFSTMSGVPAGKVAVLADGVWSSPSPPGTSGRVTRCAWHEGQLFVGGQFGSVGGVLARNLARWDGSAWLAVDAVVGGQPMGMAEDGAGRLWLASDSLRRIAGVDVQGAGYLDGSGWHAAGSITGTITNLYRDGDNVVACGAVLPVGGEHAAIAARWDGGAWIFLGQSSTYGGATSAIRTRNGTLVVVGNFVLPDGVQGAATWDGEGWRQLGSGLQPSDVGDPVDIKELPDGRLLVIGHIKLAGVEQTCVVWNGSSWTAGPQIYDPMRLLQWHGRTFVVRWGGPFVYELVDDAWVERAYEADAGALDATIGDDRILMVGDIRRIDGRPCAGVVALDMLPPPAPPIEVHPGAADGSLEVVMPSGTYDLRPVDGEWSSLGTATSTTIPGAASSARPASARVAAAAAAGGWELQRIDGQVEFSSKVLIRADGTFVVPPTGFEGTSTGGTTTSTVGSGSGSGCGAGGLAGSGIVGLIGLLAGRGRRHYDNRREPIGRS